MDSRATDESDILELENRLLHPSAEPVSLPLDYLRSITGDFSEEQQLGHGGYGVVYKGLLRRGDSSIAVKKIKDIHVSDDQFLKEATLLMGIQHPNVVRFLGYCSESKRELTALNGQYVFAEKQARMLCFEYLCKESLDKYLSDESSGLEWNTRYKIIKGICHGLNFLHGGNIIHLDLKPQNILMDATMMPKIADFGLSRLLGEQKSYTVTVTPNRPRTRGYMAPEYIDRGVISKKADIFSLGVIIIEILKGCKDDYPDYCLSTEIDFRHFTQKVLNNWRNRFERASKYTALELHTHLVKQCIDIALECVHPDKEKRPIVSNIIEILNAAEGSCCVQNGEDLLVDHLMGSQEGVPPDVQREEELVALNRSVEDYPPRRITEDIWNKGTSSGRAVEQRNEGSLESEGLGSLAALCYQGARNASFWVAHKALASLEGNLLKDWAATINLGRNIEALEPELRSMKAILKSTFGKVIHNMALKDFLMLQDLVYGAEDVLDEMEYFRIQDMLHGTINATKKHANEPPKLRFDRVNASRRIKHIVEQMKIVQQKVSSTITLLGSDWSTASNIARSNHITISESIEQKLYGRELMMKGIIHDITKGRYSTEVLTVIPIVGPGGIGKTTLAQHINHSGEVQEHFDVRVWTRVSLNFNVNKLIEEIQTYIPKVNLERNCRMTSELIWQKLKNKRLLLVLDDMWDCGNEDEWKQLLLPFRKSKLQGNIIIVTTEIPAQAEMVRTIDDSIYLEGLDHKEFKELFLDIVFGDRQSTEDHNFLLETADKIVGRLNGSPLAAKTVGRLLRRQLDLIHWIRVLESEEWKQQDGKHDIMPALKLSYDYLPSHLQKCFSYCALFPQDYKFKRKEIINFWIGLEVLHSTHGENKRVEDIGQSHLIELVNYGFLEKKANNDGKTCYIIHDLLHELARKVSSLECLSIDSSQSQVRQLKVMPSIRHLSINIDQASVEDKLTRETWVEDFNTLFKTLKVEKLRSLMLFGKHHGCFVKVLSYLFREAKALRVVFLSEASYAVEYLLHNFYNLIHLRYLRIESSSLYEPRFPKKISRFYHMMVLDAEHCGNIIYLPRDISNLGKLRHFLVRDDTTHSSIVDVGKLNSLQELRRYVVKQESQGFELRQIGHLVELCGSLCIDNLENVQVKEEADEAKLWQKSRLHELVLCWNTERSINDFTLGEHVLERLKPSSDLIKLSIKGHRGATCPSWLGTNLSIKSLESLCLDGVDWKTFPPIGELWLLDVPREEILANIPEKRFGNLKRLKLVNLPCLEKWTVHAPCVLFPFLEELIIERCYELVELSFSHYVACCQQRKEADVNLFPRLWKLEISECPQLLLFPLVPWTEAPCSIKIRGIGSSCLHSLVLECDYSLVIDGKGTADGTIWNVLAFHNLTRLKKMRSDQPLPLRYLQMLSSLRTLVMSSRSNDFPFVEADSHVKYQFPVESLTIRGWSYVSGEELTQVLVYFPKLLYLHLDRLGCWQATETPRPSSSANKVEQRQQDARAKDNIIVASEEAECGLLLLAPQLQGLRIEECRQLILHSNPRDDSNEDGRTGGGRGGGLHLQALTSLRRLRIRDCPRVLPAYSSSTSSFSFPFPNSLEELKIFECKGMETPLPLSNLTSLTTLSVTTTNCGDLRGEGLLSLLAQGHLTKLSIYGAPNFFVDSKPPRVHEQELLPSCSSGLQELKTDNVLGFTAMPIDSLLFSSLTKLVIYGGNGNNKLDCFTEEEEALLFVNSLEEILFLGCSSLHSLPERLHRLPNLKRLVICGCDAIQMLPKGGLPSSLQESVIRNCSEILPKVCFPSSLKKLVIRECQAIQMLPEDTLLSSLQELEIEDCPAIRSLPKDCLPSSLQILRIINCPAIRSLPEVDDLPSPLRILDVRFSGSNELKSQCRKLIGIIPVVRA